MENKHHEVRLNIINHLRNLKLRKIEEILDDEMLGAAKNKLSASELIERLLSEEVKAMTDRRIERRIKESKVPDRKLLVDFDFNFQTGLDKTLIMELATLRFIERKQGVIFAGSSGTGKSHIAKSLTLLACQKLYRCRYTTASDMIKDLMSGMADNSYEEKLKKYSRAELLVIDEIGFDRLEQESSRNASIFFKVIDARYCKGSTIITTNIDFKELGDYLGDPVITTAIVDRLIHHSIIINIEGPSYRMHQSKELNRSHKQNLSI